MTVSTATLTHALDEQVRRFSRALVRARRGDPTGVHKGRVASRHIREILPLIAAADETQSRRARQDRQKDVVEVLRRTGTTALMRRAKKLRYSLETERAVHRAAVARDIKTLTRMQEELGALHDVQMVADASAWSKLAHRLERR